MSDDQKAALLICAPVDWIEHPVYDNVEGVCERCGRPVWVGTGWERSKQRFEIICGPCGTASLESLQGKAGLTPQQLYELDQRSVPGVPGEEGGTS